MRDREQWRLVVEEAVVPSGRDRIKIRGKKSSGVADSTCK
jgi:hypothetical protein